MDLNFEFVSGPFDYEETNYFYKISISIISKNYYAKIILSCSVKIKMLGKVRDPFI